MGMGDELLAAGQAQRVYDADPTRKVAICDLQWRYRWHELWNGNPVIATPHEAAQRNVHKIQNAPGCRPYIRYPFTTRTGWKLNKEWRARDHVGRLYLTEAELAFGRTLIHQPYVVIEPCVVHKATRNKIWPFDRYATVVKALPEIHFVQPLHADSQPLPGVQHIKTPSLRHGCGLLAGSLGYFGVEGALHHGARIFCRRAVVIVGGALDWDVLGYPEHVGIIDHGPGSPCGSWAPCEHCRKAMDAITVEHVVQAVWSEFWHVAAPVAEVVA